MKISKMINIENENDINLDVIFSHKGFAYVKIINCKKMDECLEKKISDLT